MLTLTSYLIAKPPNKKSRSDGPEDTLHPTINGNGKTDSDTSSQTQSFFVGDEGKFFVLIHF